MIIAVLQFFLDQPCCGISIADSASAITASLKRHASAGEFSSNLNTPLTLQNLFVECILHRVQNGMVHYTYITPVPAPGGVIFPAAATQYQCDPL